MDANTLYYGDCLDWMGRWDDKSVDLIYLDPPFNSKANYNVLYSNDGAGGAQYRAFNDTWHWDSAAADRYAMFEGAAGRPAHDAIVGLYRILGESGMMAYLTYMAERLEQMRRLLKPTGSIYLHCDPTASHYLKVLMDAVFGLSRIWQERDSATRRKNRLPYMERIIKASSNPGDVVLDPFCGCGTTIEAARKLGRQWVGVDISSFAIDLIINHRLKDRTIPTKGIPYDLQSARKLAGESPFNFESWAVTRIPGFAPNAKQVADGGVDGRATLAVRPDDYDSRLALAQVKGGNFSLSGLRDFIGVTERDRAAVGCFITLDPVETKAARAEVAGAGKISVSGYPYRRMQIWPVSDYFDGRLPALPMMTNPYTGKPIEPLLL